MARLEINALCKAYLGLKVLDGLSLRVEAGEAVAIRGSSGTGKSTLLNCIGLLDRPDSGDIVFDGKTVSQLNKGERGLIRAQQLGFVFQAFHLLPEFNVIENILLAARCANKSVQAWHQRAEHLLERIGLSQRKQADVHILSGGERQRVALCRALLLSPPLLLADEPTGNLDPQTASLVLDHLMELVHDEQASLILVTHDPAIAERCDRQLALSDGKLSTV